MRVLVLLVVAACSAERADTGTSGSVHDPGILDAKSDRFHGKVLAENHWDLGVCMTCHDQSKPGAAPSCENCHADGPAGCGSCHGNPPPSGAHVAHTAKFACTTCHPTPTDWKDPDHMGDAPRFAFAAIAGAGAAFDGTRCSNVYCHGATLADPAATNKTPVWDGGAALAACGTCHGAPPANHGGGYACDSCHPKDAPHVDGIVEAPTACDGCHGQNGSPAPPRDLSGNVFTTALGVGAHQAHLTAPQHLRGPIACTDCHVVPSTITSAGHIDSPPPAEVVVAAGWDRTSATCTNACHKDARPVWTKTGEAVCGSCHGIPPANAAHAPTLQLTDCVTCHSSSVDANGYPIVNGQNSEHINGRIDF